MTTDLAALAKRAIELSDEREGCTPGPFSVHVSDSYGSSWHVEADNSCSDLEGIDGT